MSREARKEFCRRIVEKFILDAMDRGYKVSQKTIDSLFLDVMQATDPKEDPPALASIPLGLTKRQTALLCATWTVAHSRFDTWPPKVTETAEEFLRWLEDAP